MERQRITLVALAVVAGVIVALRWAIGPYSVLGIPVNVPLNPEGVFGLLITILLLWRNTEAAAPGRAWWPAALVSGVAMWALWPALRVGFLSDDFIIVDQALNASEPLSVFMKPGGDGFFRPLGYLAFDLNAMLSPGSIPAWHFFSLFLHAINTALVAMLAVRLGAPGITAAIAGTLFALHGTHLEAAVWIAGRFDLLAATFTLSTLLLFGRNTPAALVCALGALWSKEAAFVLPGLLTLLAWHEKRSLRTTAPFWALTAAAFLYRWILLGGIGGYQDASGQSSFFVLNPVSTAKVLFVRLWTSLYFPLNWSEEPVPIAALIACLYIGTLIWLALRARPHPAIRIALAGLAMSILPPLHLLGGAADLSGGRLLYLPSIWFCLLIALAINRQCILAIAVIAFHCAALTHNLPFWQKASDVVRTYCSQQNPQDPPPRSVDGVPALANGLEECRSRNFPIM